MISTIEEYLKAAGLCGDLLVQIADMQIFRIEDIPQNLPEDSYPIVDKRFGFVLFVNGGHKTITERIGHLHANQDNKHVISRESAIQLFLENGYYWSSSEIYPKLITTRRYVLDSCDEQIADRYGLSILYKDCPFD